MKITLKADVNSIKMRLICEEKKVRNFQLFSLEHFKSKQKKK